MHFKIDVENVNIHIHQDAVTEINSDVNEKLDQILCLLTELKEKGNIMSLELNALSLEVERHVAISTSAVALIQGLAAQFAAIKDDPAAIAALSVKLDASADLLAAAIEANTPAVVVVEEPVVEAPVVIEEPVIVEEPVVVIEEPIVEAPVGLPPSLSFIQV